MLTEIVGVFLIALFAYSQDFLATSFIGRPLVTGLLIGVLFQDTQNGLLMGAVLEVIWLGLMGIGATVPPDYIFGGVLGISLALSHQQGIGVAMILAFALAPIGSILKTYFHKTYIPKLVIQAEADIEKGLKNSVSRLHLQSSLCQIVILALAITITYVALDLVLPIFIMLLPQEVILGLTLATKTLPIVGLAGLFNMIVNHQLMPFPFIGYFLALFFVSDMLIFILISVVIAVGYLIIKNKKFVPEVSDEEF